MAKQCKKSNDTYKINFGPQHPATHGVLRLVLELKGETVVKADPHIGFLHRGTEKLIEYKTYAQALPYFDRLDYVSPMCQEYSYVLAIESLLKITPPKRAMYIRVMFAELTRILNHLLNITTFALDIGAMTPLLWAFHEREKIMQFYEAVSGARMHAAYFTPGGVANDLPPGLIDQISIFIEKMPKKIDEIESLLTENHIFKQRTVGIGGISKNKAINFGYTGPCLRATGILWDLRQTEPYDIYSEIDFQIPTGTNGDCYDRYMVRVFEMRESIKIVNQCIAKMPNGDFIIEDQKICPPNKKKIQTSMESLIHHFILYSQGYNVPKGEVYKATEAPKGEFGVFIVADGTNRPYKCKIRSSGFPILSSLDILCKNAAVSDVSAILGSIDIVLGDIDR